MVRRRGRTCCHCGELYTPDHRNRPPEEILVLTTTSRSGALRQGHACMAPETRLGSGVMTFPSCLPGIVN